jgi:YgiT-type zinc finger domain-containing protein
MMPFEKCPVCGGELVEKEVEKLLRGGVHTAVLKVQAEVCLRCGERLYPQETVKRFEEIRAKLERRETADFKPLGQSFQVV